MRWPSASTPSRHASPDTTMTKSRPQSAGSQRPGPTSTPTRHSSPNGRTLPGAQPDPHTSPAAIPRQPTTPQQGDRFGGLEPWDEQPGNKPPPPRDPDPRRRVHTLEGAWRPTRATPTGTGAGSSEPASSPPNRPAHGNTANGPTNRSTRLSRRITPSQPRSMR